MALEKNTVYRQQIDEFGNINVQQVTQFVEDGKIVASNNHRHVVQPGDNIKDEDAVTKKLATAVHTPAVIAAHEARVMALELERN